MKKSKRPALPDNSSCVVRSRKGKFIRWCPGCKLMLASMDRSDGGLACPRCGKKCGDISKESK